MHQKARPWRSMLYIPGARGRALEKGRSIPADALIFDLEDAVAPGEKVAARKTLAAALLAGGYGRKARIVRINGLDTAWGADDLVAAGGMQCDAILVPKVETAAMLQRIAAKIPGRPLWAMIETPGGVLGANEIASHPALEGFVLGTNDLARDLRCRVVADRRPLMAALQTTLLAARNHDKICIDGVHNAFRDEAGLRAECEQGRDLGMDGKSLVHPAQVAIANAVFGPSEEELALARRQIEAFDAALAAGQGVAVVDGSIVENLHAATARATLERAQAIRELEAT